MESTWMESNSQSIFWDSLRNFKSLGDVVPDLNCSVFGASDNQLFSYTDIKTSDFLRVVAAVNEVNL
jgi:hypothetical protein